MNKQTFDDTLERLLSEARALVPEEDLPDQPYRSESDTGWYDFELKLWAKGEEIRQLLLTSGRTLSEAQVLALLTLCRDQRGKRGRQSFLLLLGRKAYAHHAQAVAGLLSDAHVAGQAIDTLYKMGAAGYRRGIEPFLTHDKTWVRNAAKRYLEKFQ